MASVNINVRVDENLKKATENIFDELGLNMSVAINVFLKQVVREHGIPFELRLEQPNAETIAAIEEVKQMKENPEAYKGYTDVDEMMRELLA